MLKKFIITAFLCGLMLFGASGCYPKLEEPDEQEIAVIRQEIFDYYKDILEADGIEVLDNYIEMITVEKYCGTYNEYMVVRVLNYFKPLSIIDTVPPVYDIDFNISDFYLGKFHYKTEFYAYNGLSTNKKLLFLEDAYDDGIVSTEDLKAIKHYAK